MTTDRTERSRVAMVVLLWVVGPLVLFFGLVTWVMLDSELASQVDEHMAFGEDSSGEIVVVTYERQGDRSPLALPHWIASGYDQRATAVSTATGEQLWDVSVDYWWPQGPTAPLAVGGGRVYVVTEDGLVVLDAADGARIAGADEIAGLGTPALAAQGAYAYDVPTGQVVALTADGDIVGIPLGSAAATPVTGHVADRWGPILDTSHVVRSPDEGFAAGYVPGRPAGEDLCADAVAPCAVSPSGRVVEVVPDDDLEGDDLDTLVVGSARVELGTQGLWG